MRKVALVLVLLGGLFVWTGCPENKDGEKKPDGTAAPTSAKK